jgi:hypothetical protein
MKPQATWLHFRKFDQRCNFACKSIKVPQGLKKLYKQMERQMKNKKWSKKKEKEKK